MPVDLSKTLVIGNSSRALFDLEESNKVFEAQGEAAYSGFADLGSLPPKNAWERQARDQLRPTAQWLSAAIGRAIEP
jgi:hypothetical protein